MKKKRNKRNNKDTSTSSKISRANELDPINSLFLVIKKNKLKLIGLFFNIFLAIFFAIKITALHLWGIKSEFIFTMVSINYLEYLPEIICLIFVIVFTICLEIITRNKIKKLVKIIIYFIYITICSIIINILFMNNLFVFLILVFWLLTYALLYLILIRPFYLSKSRKLAQDALNLQNGKYRGYVKVMEYLGAILHFCIIVIVVGNIYSMIPSNHLVDKNDTYIVISSVQDKALISRFSIQTTKNGVRYIMLNKDTIQISTLSKLDCISQKEKLPIFGKNIE